MLAAVKILLEEVRCFAPKSEDEFTMIPQIGNVIIKDNVSIGSNTVIDNIEVELETAYGTETPTHERTSRILYGQTASLKSTETASLIGYTKTNEYISESVIRYRVRAKVLEPFGPETTEIYSSIVIGSSTETLTFTTEY